MSFEAYLLLCLFVRKIVNIEQSSWVYFWVSTLIACVFHWFGKNFTFVYYKKSYYNYYCVAILFIGCCSLKLDFSQWQCTYNQSFQAHSRRHHYGKRENAFQSSIWVSAESYIFDELNRHLLPTVRIDCSTGEVWAETEIAENLTLAEDHDGKIKLAEETQAESEYCQAQADRNLIELRRKDQTKTLKLPIFDTWLHSRDDVYSRKVITSDEISGAFGYREIL